MIIVAFAFIPALACIALVALIAAVRASREGNDRGHDDEPGSGGHGGSDRIPRWPLRPPGAGDPSWWPQFERDLAEYIDSQREGAPLA